MFKPQAHQGRKTTSAVTVMGAGIGTKMDGTMADSRTKHNDQLPQPPPILQSVAPMMSTPLVSMTTNFPLV